MAIHGSLVQFDPDKEEWTSYVEHLNYYLIANEVTDDTKKCAILMSGCGPMTYKTICSLVDSETCKTIKYNDLVGIVTSHFDPKPSSIVQRFKFYNRSREKGESIATYVAALRGLAEHCEYRDSLKIMLRDRLVCGINHEGIQRQLLSEKNLTYNNALEIALAMEAAAKDTKDLQSAPSIPVSAQLHYTSAENTPGKFKGSGKATQSLHRWPQNRQDKSQTKNAKANLSCYCCGAQNLATECRFYNAECRRCKKIGHIAKVCRSKSTVPSSRPTHYVQDSEILPTDQDTSYELFMMKDATRDPILITLELNEVPLQMELDTGASLTLINRTSYKKITRDSPTVLEHSDAQLWTYTGEAVEIMGTVTVQAKYGEQLLQLPVHVIDGDGPNLLGRDWLAKFKINLANVYNLVAPDKLDQVLTKHSQVFKDRLGKLIDVKVKLAVDPQLHLNSIKLEACHLL